MASALLLPAIAAGAADHLGQGETATLTLDWQHPAILVLNTAPYQATSLLFEHDEPSFRLRILTRNGSEIRTVSPGFAGSFLISIPPSADTNFQVQASVSEAVRTPVSVTITLHNSRPGSADSAALAQAEQIFREAQVRRNLKASSIKNAIVLLRRARARWRDGHRASGEALALAAEGDAWLRLSRYDDALHAYAAARQLVPPDSQFCATLLNSEAVLDLEVWRREAARNAAGRALAISRGVHDGRAEADARASLAIVKWLLSEPHAAPELEAALEFARAHHNRPATARILTVQGWLERDLEHGAGAIERTEEAARLFQETGRSLDALSTMIDIAGIQSLRGAPYSAVVTHSTLINIFRQAGNVYNQATANNHVGFDYITLNRPRDALPYLRDAHRLFASTGNVWDSQTAIGLACDTKLALHMYQAAEPDCAEAKRIAIQFQSPIYMALCEERSGKLAEARGRFEAAAENYRRAAELNAGMDYKRGEASATMSLGRVEYRRSGPAAALQLFQLALTLSENAEDPAGGIDAHYEIARVYADTDRLAEAQKQLEEAATLSESERDKIQSDKLRTSYFAAARKCYDLYVEVLMRRHAADSKEGFDREALQQSEAARARTLYDALHIRTAVSGRPVPRTAGLARLQAALNDRYETRLNLIITGHKQRDLDANAEQIRRLSSEYDQALALAETKDPPVAPPEPITAADLVRASSERTILEYQLGERHSYLWRIDRGAIASFQLPSRTNIDAAVAKWRELASARQKHPGESFEAYRLRVEAADRRLPAEAAKLSCMLLPGPQLEKDARLTIVPDGSLQTLPFAALPSGACRRVNGAPLVVSHEIENAPSLRILTADAKRSRRRAARKEIAIVADPVFSVHDSRFSRPTGSPATAKAPKDLRLALRDAGFNAELPQLPGTGREADAIAALAPPRSVLKAVGFQATLQTAVSAELSDYRIWHFATHGLADRASPELSGLVFSLVDEKRRPIPGYLKIQDIFDRSIDPDLVVLNACNSGLGEQVDGEGAVGISYAFLHAGAKQVAATLWSVEDEASDKLMEQFYRGLLQEHLSASAALRKAQIAILSGRRLAEPFYWAGYLLISNDDRKTPRLIRESFSRSPRNPFRVTAQSPLRRSEVRRFGKR